jgi:hypothetical protein
MQIAGKIVSYKNRLKIVKNQQSLNKLHIH